MSVSVRNMKRYMVAALLINVSLTAGNISLMEGSFSLKYNTTHFHHEIANGLGVSHDNGPYEFVSQVEDGAILSDWGNSVEGKIILPYSFDIFKRKYRPFFQIAHEEVDVNVHQLKTLSKWSNSGNFIDLLPIDGSPADAWYFGVNSPTDKIGIDYRVKERRNYGYFGLTTKLNEAESLNLSLYYARYKTTLHSSVFDPADPINTALELDEYIRGYSVGPAFQYHIEFAREGALSLFAKFGAALVYSHGELDANQKSGNTRWHVDDQRHDIGIHAEFKTGVNYHFTPNFILSMYGGTGYRNDVYKIINPRAKDGEITDDPTSYHPGPAHLDRVGEKTFSLGIQLNYKF